MVRTEPALGLRSVERAYTISPIQRTNGGTVRVNAVGVYDAGSTEPRIATTEARK
jgi:hypothetical protein